MSNLSTILSSMSSAFNNSEKNKVVSLEQDSTLKWRGLLNNTYASKESKHMRNRNEKSSSENPTTSTLVEEQTAAAADISTKVDVAKETESKAEQKQENNVDTNSNKSEICSEPIKEISKNIDENASKNGSLDVSEMTSKPSTDKTNDKTPGSGTTHDKKNIKGTKTTRNLLDIRSDRSLRSKGSISSNISSASETVPVEKKPEEIVIEESSKTEEINETKNEENITPVKRGRGRKKKHPVEEIVKNKVISSSTTEENAKVIEVEVPPKDENTEEKPRIVVTIRQNRSTNPIVIPSSNDLVKKSGTITGIKKRGRRSKQSIIKEQISQEKSQVSSNRI